jgi:hypothetical protein
VAFGAGADERLGKRRWGARGALEKRKEGEKRGVVMGQHPFKRARQKWGMAGEGAPCDGCGRGVGQGGNLPRQWWREASTGPGTAGVAMSPGRRQAWESGGCQVGRWQQFRAARVKTV